MSRNVRILRSREVFNRFVFRIDELTLQHERFDGSMSDEITRLVLNRGDSVALLLTDVENSLVLLTEQFRAPTYGKGSGWLLELPAGMLESGEDPEECARRETMEEIGYAVRTLHRIGSVFLSPGGSSERIHIFHADVSPSDAVGAGGGLKEEGEDIRLVRMPLAEALAKARNGEIDDAKTLIGLQWLELRR
jgi:nudix-type nucleoside diphosphatase (YffH/AdpP family)